MTAKKPEFLRTDPEKIQRNRFLEFSLYLIPFFVIFVGLVVATQYWAYLVGYKRFYTDIPIFVTKFRIFGLEKGYPFFNPFLVILIVSANPFDQLVQTYVLQAYTPLYISAFIAVLLFISIGIFRKQKFKNEHVYGTARWATEKDLEEIGMCMQEGIILAQQASAEVTAKVNKLNSSISLSLHKNAPFIGHSGGTNTLMIAPTRSGKGVSSVQQPPA